MVWAAIQNYASLVSVAVICFFSFVLSAVQYFRLSRRKPRLPRNPLCLDEELVTPKISIVIALKNEARFIGKTLRNIESTTIDKNNVEVILVDGGCQDNTIDVAKASSSGAIPIIYTKVEAGHSRGVAMNAGFDLITGGVVVFLKADSLLPPGYDETIRRTFRDDPSVLLASFKLFIDTSVTPTTPASPSHTRGATGRSSAIGGGGHTGGDSFFFTVAVRLIELFTNLRSRFFMLPTAAQALCVPASVFRQRLFAEAVLLEDAELVRVLRLDTFALKASLRRVAGGANTFSGAAAKFVQMNQFVTTTAAVSKYTLLGIAKHTLLEQLSLVMYLNLNFSVETIYNWCYCHIPRYTRWVKV